MPEFGAPDQFELVKQFNNMRSNLGGAPTSLGSYAPPPRIPTAPAVQSSTTGYGSMGTPGAMSAAPAATGKGLVPFNGKQVSARLVPYAQQLTGMGLRLAGGYRSPEVNAKTPGAAKNSYHMREGNSGALDLVGTARQMQQGAAWAKANGAKETLIHNAGTGLHLHVAW